VIATCQREWLTKQVLQSISDLILTLLMIDLDSE